MPIKLIPLAAAAIVAGCLSGTITNAAAGPAESNSVVFKVVDRYGRTTFVDKPSIPRGVSAERFTRHTAEDARAKGTNYQSTGPAEPVPKPDTAVAPQVPANKERAPAPAEEKSLERQLAEANESLNDHKCDLLRSNLAALTRGRVARQTAGGNRAFLTDAEIAKEKADATGLLASKCRDKPLPR